MKTIQFILISMGIMLSHSLYALERESLNFHLDLADSRFGRPNAVHSWLYDVSGLDHDNENHCLQIRFRLPRWGQSGFFFGVGNHQYDAGSEAIPLNTEVNVIFNNRKKYTASYQALGVNEDPTGADTRTFPPTGFEYENGMVNGNCFKTPSPVDINPDFQRCFDFGGVNGNPQTLLLKIPKDATNFRLFMAFPEKDASGTHVPPSVVKLSQSRFDFLGRPIVNGLLCAE